MTLLQTILDATDRGWRLELSSDPNLDSLVLAVSKNVKGRLWYGHHYMSLRDLKSEVSPDSILSHHIRITTRDEQIKSGS